MYFIFLNWNRKLFGNVQKKKKTTPKYFDLFTIFTLLEVFIWEFNQIELCFEQMYK